MAETTLSKGACVPKTLDRRRTASVSIVYPDWLVLHELARDVNGSLEEYARGMLLDVGCGAKPYRRSDLPIERWLGVDTADNAEADLHGNAYDLPVGDRTVDCILCTQVLEHLESPERALREFARVLKVGGYLILSAPQYWPLHEEPRDFFRFTELGLRELAVSTGFVIRCHRTQGLGAAVAGQALNNAILCAGDTFACKEALWFKASKAPFYVTINVVSKLAARFLRSSRDVLNHLIVAERLAGS